MAMRTVISKASKADSGTAAAEMALVAPILIALMFGAFEMGNYFYSEHLVAKAVRDGARYASRKFAMNDNCGTPTPSVVTDTQTITRTGKLVGGTERLAGWTNANTITVTLTCTTTGTYVGSGIYTGLAGGIRVVTVTATLPYMPLFGFVGLSLGSGLALSATSQVPVMGV